ncbi:unnamed protein product [Symbiodinium pilosum]|uniref:Uncharacterized protein n=1 Tax=Symbiodinium pilosum TaxID=2952 RepID=A0A812VQN8_SYMPI|nr:unnamed protein product [Symbiodinium pilosum]
MGRNLQWYPYWSYGGHGANNGAGYESFHGGYTWYDYGYGGWGWGNEQHYEPGRTKHARGKSSRTRVQPSMDFVTEFILSLPEVRGKSPAEIAAVLTCAASKIDVYED